MQPYMYPIVHLLVPSTCTHPAQSCLLCLLYVVTHSQKNKNDFSPSLSRHGRTKGFVKTKKAVSGSVLCPSVPRDRVGHVT